MKYEDILRARQQIWAGILAGLLAAAAESEAYLVKVRV